MGQSISHLEDASVDQVDKLQKEISQLEMEVDKIKRELSSFETQIHARLDNEISRIRFLYGLYKQQKREKKAKRLEQKKKGKNYKEPKQIIQLGKVKGAGIELNPEEQRELKRLYKEAVFQFHPDKVEHGGHQDKITRATAITAQLNAIYRKGDLEELVNFYQYIIMDHSMNDTGNIPEVTVDNNARLFSLKRKKEALLNQLHQLKDSYTYNVLTTYENPLAFIDELYIQLKARIAQLEKRTRTG